MLRLAPSRIGMVHASHADGHFFSFETKKSMAELITWCTTKLAILKWLQMLTSLLAILFLIDGRGQWFVYTIIFITDILLLISTFLTLVVYFFRIHVQTKNQIPWTRVELVFNLIASIVSLIFAAILMYDVIKMYNGEFRHHESTPPNTIGTSGWRNRILVVMIVEIFNAIFYGISLVRTRQYGIL